MALVTTQSKPFIQLVDLQQKSLNTLNSIKESVGRTADSKTQTIQLEQLLQLKRLLDVQKDTLALNKKAADKKDMGEISKSMKSWKTWGDKIKDMTRVAADAINPTSISKKLFGAFNVGGMFNKKIAALDYVQTRKAAGDTGKDLGARSKQYANSMFRGLRAQNDIDYMKSRGASDEDVASTKKGRAALRTVSKTEREMAILSTGQALGSKSAQDASNKMGGNTAGKSAPLPKTPSDKGNIPQSTTDILADQQSAKETQLEGTRQLTLQTALLQQIASNTSSMFKGGSSSAGGAEDSGKSGRGDGLMSGIGKGIKGVGGAVARGTRAIGAAIGGFFTGVMQGIADGIATLGTGKVVKGTAVMGLLAGVVWGFAKALKTWEDVNWDKIKDGMVISGGIIAVVMGLGKALGPALKGALAIGAVGAGLWVLGKAFQAIGEAFTAFTSNIERLSKIGEDGLVGTAKGIAAVAASIAAFGAGTAAGGLMTLVGNLLTIGQDSPLEQLEKLANMGDRLTQAASGIDNISKAMKGFAGIDKKSLDAINDFPWLRATAFVAAGGAMSVNGAKVYNQSKGNADEKAAVDAQNSKPAHSTNVSTAVQNNSTTNQVIKLPSRNTESSYSSYSRSRY